MTYARSRARNSLTKTLSRWEERGLNCSAQSWVGAINEGAYVGTQETMNDFVVPDFQRRVGKGEVFFNPMLKTTYTSTSVGGIGPHVRSKSNTCASPVTKHEGRSNDDMFPKFVSGTFGNKPSFSSVVPSGDLLQAASEASTQCLSRKGVSDTNLYEALAEYRKSADLLRSLFQRSSRVVTKNNIGRGLADEYLKVRYGLLPLMGDIGHVVNTLVNRKPKRVRKTSRGYSTLHGVSSSTVDTAYGTIMCRVTRTTNHTVHYRAMSLDEYVVELHDQLGLSLKDLSTVGWELIPYSFVADWFLNVGDYLRALAPIPGMVSLGSALVCEDKRSTLISPVSTWHTSSGYETIRPCTGGFSVEEITKTRGGLVSPSIVVRSDFRFDSFLRLADAAALIAQRILRRR